MHVCLSMVKSIVGIMGAINRVGFEVRNPTLKPIIDYVRDPRGGILVTCTFACECRPLTTSSKSLTKLGRCLVESMRILVEPVGSESHLGTLDRVRSPFGRAHTHVGRARRL